MIKHIRYLFPAFIILIMAGCNPNHTFIQGRIETNKNRLENEKPSSIQQENKQNLKDNNKMAPEISRKEDPIDTMINKMTLKEKIGQLFIVDIQKDSEGNDVTKVNAAVKEQIMTYKVGGVILFKGNIQTKTQTKLFIKDMQRLAQIPLFIGVDEEGGSVSRIGQNKDITSIPFKAAYDIGKTGNKQAAYNEAKRMGKILKELGFNLDFAPVADIYNNSANTVIGKRSFGKTKEQVSPMAISFAKGLLSENVQPVIKHFPGHGNTQEDSHEGFAYVNKTKAQLEKEELVPFIDAVNSGIDVMMRGHLIVKDIDKQYPATLSKKWYDYIKTLFNQEKVLMITDAMNMGAISKHYKEADAVVMSFLAGNDIILMPKDIAAAENAMITAYKSGKITDEQLNVSVKKILSKKAERKILLPE